MARLDKTNDLSKYVHKFRRDLNNVIAVNDSSSLATLELAAKVSGDAGNIFLLQETGSIQSAAEVRNVLFTGDFGSSANINGCNNDRDGFIVDTLEEAVQTPQTKITVKFASPSLGVGAPYDSHIVQAETPPVNGNGSAQPMTPRLGGQCFKILLDKNKDYTLMNNGTYDKPRNHLNLTSDWYLAATDPHRIPPDKEWWLGYSVYLPSNFEIDTAGRRRQLLQSHGDDSGVFWSHQIYAHPYGSGPGADKWYIVLSIIDDSIYDGGDTTNQYFDCGEIYDDLGLWTDWVFRIRWNPFSTPTNPSGTIAGAVDYDFPANTGIFQAWKSTGLVDANGNRSFIQVGPDIDGGPTGLVPRADKRVYHSLRCYYPTWKWTQASNFTQPSNSNVTGPVAVYFDEIRMGGTEEHGTTFADVNPGKLAELAPLTTPPGASEVVYTSYFETCTEGDVHPSGTNPDGWLAQSMIEACDGVPYPDTSPGSRCYRSDQDYSYARQILTSDGPVRPRTGTYMLRLETHDGDHAVGTWDPVEGWPTNERSQIVIRDNQTNHHIQYNQTHYWQMSLYLPSEYMGVGGGNPTDPNLAVQNYGTNLMENKMYGNGDPVQHSCWMFFLRCPKEGMGSGVGPWPKWSFTNAGWYVINPNTPQEEKIQIESTETGMGYKNKIPVYMDEWLDFRAEVRLDANLTGNGRYHLWMRRAQYETDYTKVVNYDGPIGRLGSTCTSQMKIYGGGFKNPPYALVAYFDAFRLWK